MRGSDAYQRYKYKGSNAEGAISQYDTSSGAAAVKMWMECKYARMMYMRARRMYMNEKSRNHHDQASESDVRRKW